MLSSPVGAYRVHVDVTGPALENYELIVNFGTPRVVKAPPCISAGNVAITYGQNPAPVTRYPLTGLVNGETAGVVSGAPVLSALVTFKTPVGFYLIAVQAGTLATSS